MANTIIELDPVTHITAGALGKPGHRTFFIQAERGLDRVTLLCEKAAGVGPGRSRGRDAAEPG